MSMYTRRHSPQGHYDIAGQTHGKVYSQAQHGVLPSRRADAIHQPFPNKPVGHRSALNPKTQDSFEKNTISKQPRDSSSQHEHHSNGIREITGSQHPRRDLRRLSSEETQMARAIHAKQLMLQDKLWRVEEKIRQRIQWDSVDTAAVHYQKSEEERHIVGQAGRAKAQTKTRQSSQILMQERRQDDVNYLRKKQGQWDEDRMRNAYEEEGARCRRREVEVTENTQTQIKGNNRTNVITANTQNLNGEWQNVKENTREQVGEKHNYIWEEAGVRPDATEKVKEKQQNKSFIDNIGWTRGNKSMQRTDKQMYSSDNEQNMSQMSQQNTAHKMGIGNPRGAEHKTSGKTTLPSVSNPSYSTRPHQRELKHMDGADVSFQLLPCSICNRKFASERLEKHIQVCKKVNQSSRQVFNSYINRTKGSAIEEFWKTHSRSKSPEVLQKNHRQNHKANTKNLQKGRLPAGTSKQKRSK
ncbi:zinc finger C2HC domain-containing protein 1C-like [Mastacembelus armatus]|uniref:zinc finger C2HC domain-containing protein 1C-like n=1 Tax=Mastacembelus armatus TaxID=205130 RepID=UPI000E464828|nr:zinc finger C2HC domain-containing protein 1C [Mastacembelus armatus]